MPCHATQYNTIQYSTFSIRHLSILPCANILIFFVLLPSCFKSTLHCITYITSHSTCSFICALCVCQVVGCNHDLTNDKMYYQRQNICKEHLSAERLWMNGQLMRFCQQCARFHPIDDFEGNRRWEWCSCLQHFLSILLDCYVTLCSLPVVLSIVVNFHLLVVNFHLLVVNALVLINVSDASIQDSRRTCDSAAAPIQGCSFGSCSGSICFSWLLKIVTF